MINGKKLMILHHKNVKVQTTLTNKNHKKIQTFESLSPTITRSQTYKVNSTKNFYIEKKNLSATQHQLPLLNLKLNNTVIQPIIFK